MLNKNKDIKFHENHHHNDMNGTHHSDHPYSGPEHDHAHAEFEVHSHAFEGHHHVHSDEEKKAVINRISRAIGHMEHVKKMVENDVDCGDVLIQLAAVRSAINNTGKIILKNHINHCVIEAAQENDYETLEKMEKAINVFIK